MTWPKILAFYYPGTVKVKQSASVMRVWISADKDGSTTVLPQRGLTVTAGARSAALPAGNGYRAWRASGTGPSLEYQDSSGAWRAYPLTILTNAPAGDLRLTSTGGTITIVLPNGKRQELRGSVHASVSGGKVLTVLHSTMESYLRSVVPNEMPSSWHLQAVAAQSVAARTYAAAYRQRQRARGSVWDVCDTVTCQVFKGVATSNAGGGNRSVKEDARSTTAIALTNGSVLRTNAGSLAYTEFSASNGGYSTSGGTSYLVAKPDPYDGVMKHSNTAWSTSVDVRTIERAYRLGRLLQVRINARDGKGALGGRVRSLTLVGTSASRTVSGVSIRFALGLKSDWFTVTTKGGHAAGLHR